MQTGKHEQDKIVLRLSVYLLVATRQCVFLDLMLHGLYIFYALESKQQPRNSFSPHFVARNSVHLNFLYLYFVFVIRMF